MSLTVNEREIAAARAETYPEGYGYVFFALPLAKTLPLDSPFKAAEFLKEHPEFLEAG